MHAELRPRLYVGSATVDPREILYSLQTPFGWWVIQSRARRAVIGSAEPQPTYHSGTEIGQGRGV